MERGTFEKLYLGIEEDIQTTNSGPFECNVILFSVLIQIPLCLGEC